MRESESATRLREPGKYVIVVADSTMAYRLCCCHADHVSMDLVSIVITAAVVSLHDK